MNPDFKKFMSLRFPPARLSGEQVGWRFGMTRDEVRIVSSAEIISRIRSEMPAKELRFVLSGASRLRPLGDPSAMATKYFCEAEVSHLENDPEWLDRAVWTIRQYWIGKKKRRRIDPAKN